MFPTSYIFSLSWPSVKRSSCRHLTVAAAWLLLQTREWLICSLWAASLQTILTSTNHYLDGLFPLTHFEQIIIMMADIPPAIILI